MTATEETTATATAPATPAKAKPAKKPAAPKAKPAPAVKPAAPAKAKPDAGEVDPAKVLKPQARILAALAKLKPGATLNRLGVAEKAGIDKNWVIEYIGAEDGGVSSSVRGALKLIPAKLVRSTIVDVDGQTERRFEITAAGKKRLERLAKEE